MRWRTSCRAADLPPGPGPRRFGTRRTCPDICCTVAVAERADLERAALTKSNFMSTRPESLRGDGALALALSLAQNFELRLEAAAQPAIDAV